MIDDTVSRIFTIIKHSKSEVSDKQPVYIVQLKAEKILDIDSVMTLTIKSTQNIFDQFPLKDKITVQFKNPQQRLC